MLRPADRLVYTTESLLDADQGLLEAERQTSAPTISVGLLRT